MRTMKLAMIIAAGSLALATPVFACPGHDGAAAPKTAEKAPAKEDKTAEKKDTTQEKTETKDTAKAAPAKDTAKKPADKVSQK